MQPQIIILRGNSGSGKTTIAKNLQKSLGRGTLLIPQDVVRREMLYVNDVPNNKAIDLLIELVKFGKTNCQFIILEGILFSKRYQKLFNMIRSEFHNIYAYYFDIPFEETLERHKTKPNAHEFGEAEMRSWWIEKDYLPDFNEHIIHKNMTEDEIIEMILHHINN